MGLLFLFKYKEGEKVWLKRIQISSQDKTSHAVKIKNSVGKLVLLAARSSKSGLAVHLNARSKILSAVINLGDAGLCDPSSR